VPVHVGTSGWQYRDWRGVLYPPGLPQRSWLEYYAARYATVENNGTFYRLPAPETFADWRARTPDGFVMAVKASRYLTHVRRLRDPAEPVEHLLRAASGLGDRLGPVLLQLPPNLRADADVLDRLDRCLRAFSECSVLGEPGSGSEPRPVAPPAARPGARGGTAGRIRIAVEFRHPSWWTEEVRQLLAGYDAALCWADQLGRPTTPLWRTAGWGYLRFHQGAAQPWPRYGLQALRSWMQRTTETWVDDADVFVYFNNDQGGAAVHDAAAFAALIRLAGREVTRTAVPGESGDPG